LLSCALHSFVFESFEYLSCLIIYALSLQTRIISFAIMKTIYPLVALLSAAIVAAGPIPKADISETRSNDLIHAPQRARTEAAPAPAPPVGHVAAPAPAPPAGHVAAAPAPAPPAEHVAAPPAPDAEAQRLKDEEAKKAADAMEAEHVAKAEAEAKAHQEGMCESSSIFNIG
jgi:hypothetical protein